MKKITLSLLASLFAIVSIAQSPQAFKYQTVVRDNTGAIIANQAIGFRISILDDNATGPVVYQETHLTNTNDFGLASLEVGNGTPVSGIMADVDWSTNDKFLQIEIDVAGGSAYDVMGTTQLLSVPYSLYSETTGDNTRWIKSGIDDLYYLNGKVGIGTETPSTNLEIHNTTAAQTRLKLSSFDYSKSLFFTSGSATFDPGIYIEGADALRFIQYEAGVGYNELMRITANGNVGIGTQLPQGILDIAGQYHFPSTDGTDGQVLRTDGNGVLSWSSAAGGVSEINDLYDGISDFSSVFLGYGCGVNDDGTMNENVGVGIEALLSNIDGYGNTAIGSKSLSSNTTGINNTAIGSQSLYSNSSGLLNTALGYQTLYSNIDGKSNTAVGYKSMHSNTSGKFNTASGHYSLNSNTTGSVNIAIGARALYSSSKGNFLVAIGDSALYFNGIGATESYQASNNTALGSKALYSNTLGYDNTAVGFNSLYHNIDGIYNSAIGYNTLYNNTNGKYNVAFGVKSLYNNTTGEYNTAVGSEILYYNTSGDGNTAIGMQALVNNTEGDYNTANGVTALLSNTTGNCNVAIGKSALYSNTDRSYLVAIGDSALYNNGIGASVLWDATGNTAVGSKALFSNTYGRQNTAIGSEALYSNTAGSFNTASGFLSLYSNTSGSSNTAYGHEALNSNINGSHNTAIGTQALPVNTSGHSNTATGASALKGNIDGDYNTANGTSVLTNNTTGHYNSAYGYVALFKNTAGSYNTAIGVKAMYNNDNGDQNTAIGRSSLYDNKSGKSNTAVGTYTLINNISGNNNAAVGRAALYSNTTGHSNVALGSDALFKNTDRSNLIAIGDSALYNNGIGANDPENSVNNVAVGSKALYTNTKGAQNTAIGNESLFSMLDDYNNVAIGYQSLYSTQGSFNTAVGSYAGRYSNGSGNVFIGYQAGYNETGSGKLYIESGASSSPLIYGEFNNGIAAINGKLGVGTMTPSTDLDVNGTAFISTKLEIGTFTASGYKMSVTGGGGTLVRWNRTGSDGQVVDIQNDGTYAGGISVSGGTVSYNSFTGSHLGASEKEYFYGEIVSMTGQNGNIEDQPEAEVVYGISKTSIANDKSVLGTYLGRFDGSAASSAGILHNIMAVGNGRMWVVENGSDITPGDYLISSATLGHGMKDPGSYPVSHIIARAAQTVDWEHETETVNGEKHKLISVTFESFDKINLPPASRVVENQSISQNQQEKIEDMQALIDQQNQILTSQQVKMDELLSRIESLESK